MSRPPKPLSELKKPMAASESSWFERRRALLAAAAESA
jgi:hypothetical protein